MSSIFQRLFSLDSRIERLRWYRDTTSSLSSYFNKRCDALISQRKRRKSIQLDHTSSDKSPKSGTSPKNDQFSEESHHKSGTTPKSSSDRVKFTPKLFNLLQKHGFHFVLSTIVKHLLQFLENDDHSSSASLVHVANIITDDHLLYIWPIPLFLRGAHGVLVPGVFGDRGEWGKILASKYACEKLVIAREETLMLMMLRKGDFSMARWWLVYTPQIPRFLQLRTFISLVEVQVRLVKCLQVRLKSDHQKIPKLEPDLSFDQAFDIGTEWQIRVQGRASTLHSFVTTIFFLNQDLLSTIEIVELRSLPLFVGLEFHQALKSRPDNRYVIFLGSWPVEQAIALLYEEPVLQLEGAEMVNYNMCQAPGGGRWTSSETQIQVWKHPELLIKYTVEDLLEEAILDFFEGTQPPSILNRGRSHNRSNNGLIR